MGVGDGHGSSGGHPLENLRFSIQDDDTGNVVRVHHENADDVVCGNTTPSSYGDRRHRQTMDVLNAGTAQDLEAYHSLRDGDPDFETIRQQMQELTSSGHVTDEDAKEISYNPRRFIHEYMLLKDAMVANERDLPRQYEVEELKQAITDERNQGGSTHRLRSMEIRLAGRYLGAR